MCGIVGALTFDQKKITQSYVNEMRDEMTHRGPDGCGTWISNDARIGLGHRRLSIIDLTESADQPMQTKSGRYVLTFNGEIYNHHEIRKDLIADGVVDWKTDHSDSETLLKAFEHYGIGCLEKLRGMFAFAIWDKREKALWLVRDRIGVKPLYYSLANSRVVFASEIKAILADKEQPREINPDSFLQYLSFLTTLAPATLLKGIYKLEPGTWLRIDIDGKIRKKTYWEVLENSNPIESYKEKEVIDRIRHELEESIKLRKESDVPVGVFLSGGVDSSINAALFSNEGTENISTFSIGYQQDYKSCRSELSYAKEMAKKVSSNHHEKLLTADDVIDFLPEMAHFQDEPIGDPVCIPVYYLSKLARQNSIKVCQVGEGADELLAGYPLWSVINKLQKIANIPGSKYIQKKIYSFSKSLNKDNKKQIEYIRRGGIGQPLYWGGAEGFFESQTERILHPNLRSKFSEVSSWDTISPIWKNFLEESNDISYINWMSYVNLKYRLPELLLMRVDKMSMGAGLECRVPFLDHKFVEYVMGIPSNKKIKKGCMKYLLKEAARGLIPDEVLDRKKQGFGLPVHELFFDKLGKYAKEKIFSFCQRTELISREGVESLFKSNSHTRLWFLLNFVQWHDKYIGMK